MLLPVNATGIGCHHKPIPDYGEFFNERVCRCLRPKLDRDYPYEEQFIKYEYPPPCRSCGKWLDKVFTCGKCSERFYQFFRHPGLGYIKNKGWYCWDCCEKYMPVPNFQYKENLRSRVPPPALVLPPGQYIA